MAVDTPSIPIPSSFAEAFSVDFPNEESNLLMQTLSSTAPIVSLRRNLRKFARFPHTLDYLEKAKPIPWSQEAYWLPERPEFAFDPLWHAGAYYVQEAASMAIAFVKEHLPKHPMHALDLCAAPGGKSTLLADLLPTGSTLLCNDPIYKRAVVLAENMVRCGFPETIVTSTSPAKLATSGLLFDLILVDAPCSGEGMFRKSESARADWSPTTIKMCARRQQEILDEAWKMLRAGGRLLYSTCTFNKQENEENVALLIRKGANIVPLSVPSEWGFSPSEDNLGYHCFPHRIAGEGFFFSLLQKPFESKEELAKRVLPRESIAKGKKQKKEREKASRQEKGRCIPPELTIWLGEEYRTTALFCEDQKGHFFALPQALQEDYLLLQTASIPILQAGISLGKAKGTTFQPDGRLHFSLAFNPNAFPQYALDRAEALIYLTGASPAVSLPLPFSGLGLVCYCGVPLGFVNAVSNRFNNLYPKNFRLRQLHR